jgi:hypothetical protein
VDRCERFGLAGLEEHKRGGGREQASAAVRASILALTRTTSPTETGQSHWSSREMARDVSFGVARVGRYRPQQQFLGAARTGADQPQRLRKALPCHRLRLRLPRWRVDRSRMARAVAYRPGMWAGERSAYPGVSRLRWQALWLAGHGEVDALRHVVTER